MLVGAGLQSPPGGCWGAHVHGDAQSKWAGVVGGNGSPVGWIWKEQHDEQVKGHREGLSAGTRGVLPGQEWGSHSVGTVGGRGMVLV